MHTLNALSKRTVAKFIFRTAQYSMKDSSGKEHEISTEIGEAMVNFQETGDPKQIIDVTKDEIEKLFEKKLSSFQRESLGKILEKRFSGEKTTILEKFTATLKNGETSAVNWFKSYLHLSSREAWKIKDTSINAPVGKDGDGATLEGLVPSKQKSTEDEAIERDKDVVKDQEKKGKAQIHAIEDVIDEFDKFLRNGIQKNALLKELKFDMFSYILGLAKITKNDWQREIDAMSTSAEKCDLTHLQTCHSALVNTGNLIQTVRKLIGLDGEKSSGSLKEQFAAIKEHVEDKDKFQQEYDDYDQYSKLYASYRGYKRKSEKEPDNEAAKKKFDEWNVKLKKIENKKETYQKVDKYRLAIRNELPYLSKKATGVIESLKQLEQVLKQAYYKALGLMRRSYLSKRQIKFNTSRS